MKNATLIYFASDIIEEFCGKNPIDWADPNIANGAGNILTPTPAMNVFFSHILKDKRLFNQREYVEFAWHDWGNWKKQLTQEQIDGVESRLFRNFYPSAIDSLHVWALMVETGKFAMCELDVLKDAVSKTDLTVWTKDRQKFQIELRIDSKRSLDWCDYKYKNRGQAENAIPILLPMARSKGVGNKRWYRIKDLDVLLDRINNKESTIQKPEKFKADQTSLFDFEEA